ncbi:MAG: hypothetical protein Q9184_002803 [Pyrenodesmia sp. 2 TL-2023]
MVAHGQPHPVAIPFLSSYQSPLQANSTAHPPAQTESARTARKSFYCDLCQKGYGRINEFEAHEGSYDHLHKKVLTCLSYPIPSYPTFPPLLHPFLPSSPFPLPFPFHFPFPHRTPNPYNPLY